MIQEENKIIQLPPHVALAIAAGEVVERPANIVKELIENSLDADATHITLSVLDGGKKLIRIQDNGCGMSVQDAQNCFLKHATSKLTAIDQLESVLTYGFRGEALASISSVANVTLKTKTKHAREGTAITIAHSNVLSVESTACVVGTDVAITDLFAAIPARKKFLKQSATEYRQIQQLFYASCLQSLSTHFVLMNEHKTAYNCPPVSSVADRWKQLHVQQSSRILPLVELEHYGVQVSGIITDHQHARYDRSGISIFVNNRWVKNQDLQRAFLKGYQNVLPQGKFPEAVLYVTVDQREVDINIHPRKEEVKFLHPRIVEQQVQLAVKTTLEKYISHHILPPDQFFRPKQSHFNYNVGGSFQSVPLTTSLSIPFRSFDFDSLADMVDERETLCAQPLSRVQDPEIKQEHTAALVQTVERVQTQETIHPSNYTLIGNFNNTYILIEHTNNLVLIDQHAAHERVLYEEFANRFAQSDMIQLLFAKTIELKIEDMQIICQHLGLFIQNGIHIEQFNDTQLVVRATSIHAKNLDIQSLVHEMIGCSKEFQYVDIEAFEEKIHHKLRAQMSCKAAIKAGDLASNEQMQQLISDLHKAENNLTCPHGRPTMWIIGRDDIEKKFKRKL